MKRGTSCLLFAAIFAGARLESRMTKEKISSSGVRHVKRRARTSTLLRLCSIADRSASDHP